MNEAMRDYWNGDVGRTWADMQSRMDGALAPVTDALLAVATAKPGDRVLDVGCGAGDTSFALAHAVAPDGHVLGVDVSAPLLERARDRAAGTSAVFIEADAANIATTRRFDLVVSRFGVMFFDDSVAAFDHLRSLAEPDGRLAFACWRSPADNLWATLPVAALAGLLPPAAPADPHVPGPFAFADAARVTDLLARAGWLDVAALPIDFTMAMGAGDDPAADAADFSLRIGPAARALADAVAAGTLDRAVAAATIAAAYAPHVAGGVLALPAGIWLVTARA